MLLLVSKILSLLVPLIIAIAYLTLAERKVMGLIQRRIGPNVVGIFGLLQPFADGLKMLVKEVILPTQADRWFFFLAPLITLTFAFVGWAVIPFGPGKVLADLNLGILYLLAISSLGVYGIICAGWSSNSKYGFLGSLRSTAQMISYEVSLGLLLIGVILCAGSLNLTDIVLAQRSIWYLIPLFPLSVMFFVSALAETNRTPFDLPEAEGEIVAGFHVEYSSMSFTLFYLAEYANILLMCTLASLFFLGGWLGPFFAPSFWLALKICFFVFLFIWIRAAYPRYRYDQLMSLCWKSFLPLALGYILFLASLLKVFEGFGIDDRVVYGMSLENSRRTIYRGFKSHSILRIGI